MSRTRLLTGGIVGLLLTAAVQASPLTFLDDYEGFVEAAPAEVRSIDFETLPDGSPSWVPAEITREFNYTPLGVTFLPHRDPGLYIYGNAETDFHLGASSYPDYDRNWIVAELVEPASAVGTYFVSSCFLCAYGMNGELLAEVALGAGGTHFVGIVSDVPISYSTIDMNTWIATSDEFVFASVPEPSVLLMLLIGSGIALSQSTVRIR